MSRLAENRWIAFEEILLVTALIAGDYYGVVPVTSTPFLLAIGWASLWVRRLRWGDVGLARPDRWGQALGLGVLAGVTMELFSTFVTVPWFAWLTGSPPDLSDFRPMVGDLKVLLIGLAIGWPLAAFGEEMGFRGYLLNRCADLAGRTRAGWVFGLIVTSVLFGWGHGGQGLTGMLQETWAGLLLGLLYLACGRNLTIPIVAHGVANTVAFLLIYFDRYPGV